MNKENKGELTPEVESPKKILESAMAKFGKAHDMLARTKLSSHEYQPISSLLSHAKVELFNYYNTLPASPVNVEVEAEEEEQFWTGSAWWPTKHLIDGKVKPGTKTRVARIPKNQPVEVEKAAKEFADKIGNVIDDVSGDVSFVNTSKWQIAYDGFLAGAKYADYWKERDAVGLIVDFFNWAAEEGYEFCDVRNKLYKAGKTFYIHEVFKTYKSKV